MQEETLKEVDKIIVDITNVLPKMTLPARRLLQATINEVFDSTTDTQADLQFLKEVQRNMQQGIASNVQLVKAGINICPHCRTPKENGYYYPLTNRHSQVMEFRLVCLTCEKPKPITDVPEPTFDCNELFLFMGVARQNVNATLRLWEYFVNKPDVSNDERIPIHFEINDHFHQFTAEQIDGLQLSEIHQDLKMMKALFGKAEDEYLLVYVKYN